MSCLGLCLLSAISGWAEQRIVLHGHVPEKVTQLHAVGRLPEETTLHLAIGLPLHNTAALTNLIRDISDPANPQYHHYLTAAQFAEQFGPTKEDYLKVVRFTERHGLRVSETHPNRMVVDVAGAVTNVEEAFQLKIHTYLHPTEHRLFYAPDTEPSVEADTPILHVSGLDNYVVPHPMNIKSRTLDQIPAATPESTTGSGPGGSFTGKDLRPAYAPGVTNTGAGQSIALIEFGPYYTNDIYMYETNAGIPTSTVITNILLDGTSGIPSGASDDDGEEALDIDMSIAMASNATIMVYEGTSADDMMNRIATDNRARQISLSWGFGVDATIEQIFQEYVAQGQTFFQASGDGGADVSGGTGLTGEPYATICGGTALTTTGPGGRWISETTWIGSGGGISGYGIPPWQQGISMTANQGSTVNRNYPDVAILADTVIFWYSKNGQSGEVGGTSAAAPQWTGIMSLVNQSAAAQGQPPVGFINPALYAIGKGAGALSYQSCFHDITTGNDFSSQNPTHYAATSGYDLCTGLGSPITSSLIKALLDVGTNDFVLSASQVGLNIVRGGTASTLILITPMNGFTSAATLEISGLPNGVTATFSPPSNVKTSILTLTTTPAALPGNTSLILTATAGGLTHVLTLNLTVTPPIPGAVQVGLSAYFNSTGIYTDGTAFSGGGFDGDGDAYSANLLGITPNLNNVLFNLGPANAKDVINSAGQTITLPAGQFTTLQMLAAAVNNSQNSQTFTITYTDNSTAVITQNISDWYSPENNAGEFIVEAMPYRNNSDGTKDNRTFNLYDYSLTLNQTKTVKSISLPNNGNVKVLAITMVNGPTSASLAASCNRAGMYTDGTTFTNPPTGGLDGGGEAYSATLLGSEQIWNGIQFNFAPPNVTNVISCASQTITLPPGNYFALRMLATGIQGNQANQVFTVRYTDNTATPFSQSFSDWFTPANYAGETKAFPMGYRNNSDGTKDKQTFYLYGYSFNLNSAKVVRSIQLPNNGHVAVTSISLVPNWQPVFTVAPFTEPAASAGQPYSAAIATNASDFNSGDTLVFAKVSGPAWLVVAGNGALSGTPFSSDVGVNTFLVSVTDAGGLSSTASLNIQVIAAPPIIAGVSVGSTNLVLNWTGGIAPYDVQMNTDLTSTNWIDISGLIDSNTQVINASNEAAFYRILGQ